MFWLKLHPICVIQKKKLLINAFFKDHLMKIQINRSHENALGLFIMIKSFFMDLLVKVGYVAIGTPPKNERYIRTC